MFITPSLDSQDKLNDSRVQILLPSAIELHPSLTTCQLDLRIIQAYIKVQLKKKTFLSNKGHELRYVDSWYIMNNYKKCLPEYAVVKCILHCGQEWGF